VKRIKLRLFVWLYNDLNPTLELWQAHPLQRGFLANSLVEFNNRIDLITLEVGQTSIELYRSPAGKRVKEC